MIANDKVNLDIYKGEILSLLGENGSGKTTLMNIGTARKFYDLERLWSDAVPMDLSGVLTEN